MRTLYILAALCLIVAACAKPKQIDWDAVDYGVIRALDSYREETHK
jgi:hypothetical protein